MVERPRPLNVSLTEVAPIPDSGVESVLELMKTGALFRYGETNGTDSYVSKLEMEFARLHKRKYAIAVNSGGSALYLALKAAGIDADDQVMLNSFTLSPVPGAIENCGAETILLECTENMVLDLQSLEYAVEKLGARCLLLSYMRGHVPDMEKLLQLVEKYNLLLIEDCAHVLGAQYDGQMLGTFGLASCFSLQTYKQVNGGEGGIILTDDEDIAAKAILMSGSYMLYGQHSQAPEDDIFKKWKGIMPNYSLRLNEVSAAIVLSQLPHLEELNDRWRRIHSRISDGLSNIPNIVISEIPSVILSAPTSIQFNVNLSPENIEIALAEASSLGLEIKWFGRRDAKGFTSTHHHWEHISKQHLAQTNLLLEGLMDIRLPSTLSDSECDHIVDIVAYSFSGFEGSNHE